MVSPGGAQGGVPADGLGGVRHEGGVGLIQALLWNVGTCRSEAKGSSQVGRPHTRCTYSAPPAPVEGGHVEKSVDCWGRHCIPLDNASSLSPKAPHQLRVTGGSSGVRRPTCVGLSIALCTWRSLCTVSSDGNHQGPQALWNPSGVSLRSHRHRPPYKARLGAGQLDYERIVRVPGARMSTTQIVRLDPRRGRSGRDNSGQASPPVALYDSRCSRQARSLARNSLSV